MSNSNTSTSNKEFKQEHYRDILCDALDCENKYTDTIKVDAGLYGKIPLKLCKRCLNLFKE